MLSGPPSSVPSPESGSPGAGEPAARRVQRIQVGIGHELVHPRRRQPGRRGQLANRNPLGAGRDQRPHPFPLGLLQPPRGPADPRQHPLLSSARFDPLADRHPPNLASSVQETGRRSGADRSPVTATPAPLTPLGPPPLHLHG